MKAVLAAAVVWLWCWQLTLLAGGLMLAVGCRSKATSKQAIETHDEIQVIEPNGTGGVIVVLADGQRLEFKNREEFVAYMKSIGRPGDWGSAEWEYQ
jgi:hypothetical protein